jgi:hypothetical protein
MLSHTIAAFCIIDDALQAMGYKDDPQAKTPASAILSAPPSLQEVISLWTYAVLKIPDKMGLKMFPYGKAAGD